MDRLEAYLDRELESITTVEQVLVWVVGSIIPLLLFANDIVLLSCRVDIL